MAKDRDKQQATTLFGAVDDKSISFQRAVFIVCNLRRLIKRPKKEDKNSTNSSGGSRKRSGGTGDSYNADRPMLGPAGCQEGVAMGSDPSGKLRFRDPIRRAFTLPSILCGVSLGQPAAMQRESSDNSRDWDRAADDQDQDQEDQSLHSEDDSDGASDQEETNCDQLGDEGASRRRGRGRRTRWSQPSTRSSASPVNLDSVRDCDRTRGATTDGDCLTPLSCLVTPIRRIGTQTATIATSDQDQRLRRSGPRATTTNKTTGRARSSQRAGAHQSAGPDCNQNSARFLSDCHGNGTDNKLNLAAYYERLAAAAATSRADETSTTRPTTTTTTRRDASSRRQTKTGGANQTICCPIWSLAMELLDASQMQPRDQSRHGPLLGPPSSLSYLLAPSCLGEESTSATSNSLPPRGASNDSGDGDDIEATVERARRDGEPAREDQSSGDDDDKQDDGQLGEQMARLRMMGFSSSALCLNNAPQRATAARNKTRAKGKPSGGGGGGTPIDSSKPRSGTRPASNIRCNDTAGAESSGYRPKQLATSDTNDELATRNSSSSTTTDTKIRRPKITVSTLGLGGVEDPIVTLARQRRPSVTNQGTLNVDQQALFSAVECNQLERVKSILDEAKVNVNSLNGDKLTCLDVAVLLRNSAMVRLLQQYKAKESSAYLTCEGRENQLYSLYLEARRLVEDLSRSIGAIAAPSGQHSDQATDTPNKSDQADGQSSGCCSEQPQQLMLATGSLLSSALFEEKHRQLQYWRRRLDLFMQMRYGFEKLDLPSVPELAVLQVVGENSLGLKIVHSLGQINELFSSLVRQQRNQSNQNSRQINNQLAASGPQQLSRPMNRLIALAQERRLCCPLGAKCSHWLMDELVAYRQNSDQFQSYDPDDLLMRRQADGEQPPGEQVRQRQVKDSSSGVRFQARNSEASERNLSSTKSRQQQEKLAIFNQLLAQQLTILSQQQRHQQQLDFLQSSRSKPSAAAAAVHQHQSQQPNSIGSHHHHQQLIYAHQIESTDSAYDNIAAAVASKRQQQQLALLNAGQPAAACGAALDLNQRQTGGAYRSLAYQLMTARRYNHLAELDHVDQVGADYSQESGGGGVQTTRTKLFPTNSVKMSNQKESSESNTGQRPTLFEPTLLVGGGAAAGGLSAIETAPLQSVSSTSTIITKYKVEWSTSASFEPAAGSLIVYSTGSCPLECQIGNLENGQTYFVRVSSGNHKGFSSARLATPACLAPSSWRQVSQQPGGGGGGGGSRAGVATLPVGSLSKKKFKYDEEVFRKFTKLILLNKHILDENQLNWLQREQQRLQLERDNGASGASGPTGLSWNSSKWAASKMTNLQNKSSLINMLLLDATMPSNNNNNNNNTLTNCRPGEHNNSRHLTSNTSSLANISHQFQISTASSPRGSLYPVTSAINADNDNDSILSGQSNSDQQQQQQQQQSTLKVRKNLRNFFQSNSAKFNKLNNQNKRGLYLASVIYHATTSSTASGQTQSGRKAGQLGAESALVAGTIKLVVTNDDRLPVIEIFNDLVAPSTLMADFHWLLKINGTNWIDMKRLRQQLQRSHSSSTLHLRIKLLAAIEQMQLALNLEDIGRLFYKPIQAHDGSIVICTCRSVANTKQVSNLSIKWTGQHKLITRHLRKIYDMIALANKQRERQQEQQARQKQQQQQQQQQQQLQATRTSLTCSGQAENGHHHLGNCPQQQQVVCLNKRHSSSAMTTGSSGATPTPTRPVTGLSSDNLQVAAAASACTALVLSENKTLAEGTNDNQLGKESNYSQTTATTTLNLVPTQSEAPPGGQDPQTHDTRFLSATTSTTNQTPGATNLPSEFGRLCDICQHAIAQRRCTMASGSSSSSLASNESQSWSSSQYSLNSQQAPSSSRSCTCSRSNSSVAAASLAGQIRVTTTTTITSTSNSQPPTGSACCSHLNINSQAASMPASQRNSTSQSTRSASGSVGMMMMMMGQSGGRHEHQFQSSGSFSLVGQTQAQQQQLNTTTSNSVSGPSLGSMSGPTSGQRQTQSQQFNSSECADGPQSTSTYLMLASLSLYDLLLFHMKEIIEFDQASMAPLKRGLYLGFMQLQTTVESMRLLVPRRRPNMLPCARIRDNAHVSREEWELLKKFASLSQMVAATAADGADQTTSGRRAAPVSCTGRSNKINVPATVVDCGLSPVSNASSRSSDPAIWKPRQSVESLGQDQRLKSQVAAAAANQHPDQLQQTRQLPPNLATSSVGFERDRAKSVSPGLVHESATLNGSEVYKAAISRAQHLARASREQDEQKAADPSAQCQDSHSDPPTEHSGSCLIGPSNELAPGSFNCENNAHAHSDTDLPMSLSSTRPCPQRAATASEFDHSKDGAAGEMAASGGGDQIQSASDSNLVADSGEQQQSVRSNSPKEASGPAGGRRSVGKRKSGSSGSIATHLQHQLQQSPEMTFVRLIGDTAKRLLLELKSELPKVFDETKLELVSILNSLNDEENNRVCHIELIELSNQVTFILLIPSPENVCPVTSNERSNILAHHPEYMLLPLQIFETIHLATYEPDLLGKYSRLSTILETDLIVAQHDHRQAFSSNELKSTKSRVSHLQDMVSIADEFWRQLRWIVDVVSFARDKSQLSGQTIDQTSGFIKLGAIWRHFDRLASNPAPVNVATAAAAVSSCCTSSSAAVRKSVESVALSVTDGDNDMSQHDPYGSSSSSLVLQDHRQQQQQLNKSPLMKTNSSNSQDQRRRLSGQKAKDYNDFDWAETNSTGDGHDLGRSQEIARISSFRAKRLPEIHLPVGVRKPIGGGDQSSELVDDKQKNGPKENKTERDRQLEGPQAKSDQNFNHDSKEAGDLQRRAPDSNWQVLNDSSSDSGGGAGPLSSALGNFEERILNVKLGKRDHELVLVSQDDDEFAGDESRQGDQNEIIAQTDAFGARRDDNHQRHGGNQEDDDDDGDDGEAAIYAYHISLRDATKAAAKRKSSQQLINLFIDQSEPPNSIPSSGGDWQVTNNNENDASTCGGLNLDRRQLEQFKLAALARAELRANDSLRRESNNSLWTRRTPDELNSDQQQKSHRSKEKTLAQSDFYLGLGEVVAYKFKKVTPNSLAHCSTTTSASKTNAMATQSPQQLFVDADQAPPGGSSTNDNRPVLDEHQTTGTKQVGGGQSDAQGGQPTPAQRQRASQFKSTNPFLTDSFDM